MVNFTNLRSVASGSGTGEASLTESYHTSSSSSTTNPDLARVFVKLANGTKIVVPVPQNSSVHELHVRTLQRAARLGVHATLETTVLKTLGNSPVVLFGEDGLTEVLDLTEDNTFALGSLEDHSAAAQPTPSDIGGTVSRGPTPSVSPPRSGLPTLHEAGSVSQPKDPNVYVRWITLEAALENSRLKKIPVDKVSIPSDTTLKDFHLIAMERLCNGTPRGLCTNPRKVTLYLRECILHTEGNMATLDDLGVRGGKHDPLDIFVEFTGPESPKTLSQLSLPSDLQSLWSIDSTKLGISTFVTCIKMLLKEIERGRCSLEGILEALLELTHFPPLLLAFSSVHETGIDTRAPVNPLLLVASAFHALSSRMVPSEICDSTDTYLESSRQIACWIYSMRSEASTSRGTSKMLVHRAQITATSDDPEKTPTPKFRPFSDVEVQLTSEAELTKKTFLVSIETGDRALCQKLGISFHLKSASPWDFYFQPVDNWDILWDHRIVPLLHQNEFSSLIETANSMDAFRMVGPMQIGACLAAELPVITLSATGYVSTYDHEDLECSERSFVTWNPIEGRTKMLGNPGQFLSQKLDLILPERKKSAGWELDAWPEWSKTADFGPPDEAIVICVDTSSSMDICMPKEWIPDHSSVAGVNPGMNPSRLVEVKEFFKNLALRISALNLSTHLGLVTFSNRSQVLTKQPLTALHLNFHHQLESVNASGHTAIFDALNTASIMLRTTRSRYPKTKCRIILLTDGQDNNSSIQASTVSQDLYKHSIVLDAVVIGTTSTISLFKIAKATGGYAFSPKTQQELFQIFLLETVVDIRTRPDIVKTKCDDWDAFKPKVPDMPNAYEFPRCRPHPNLQDYFIALGDAERFMIRMSRRSASSAASVRTASTGLSMASTMTPGAGGASRILLSEIKAMIDNPHHYMDIYVSQSNMGFWKVVMQGPPDSPYANGTFLLYIELGQDFPRRPPSARFITPILHPNITKHGRVCHPIFDREWTPATRVYQVLQQLYGIMMSLEARDAVDPLSALRFWSDPAEGQRMVENYITRFARRSRALHRIDIIGDDVSSTASSSGRSTASGSTITSPSPQPQSTGQNPFSNPPSYRSLASSISGASVRSTSTASTLLGHLTRQRRPQQPQPPPLMATTGAAQPTASPSPIVQVGHGGRNMLRRLSSSSGSGSGSGTPGSSESGNETGNAQTGRRLSRRASFFDMLRNVRN
ncbi:hypothetical protein ACEPPN_010983 [Leptodophora sp. 'Broadleaf-Isolate-01']